MGVAYYIVLEPEIAGLDMHIDGKRLARHLDPLDAAAQALGVRPLSDFVNVDSAEWADCLDSNTDYDAEQLPVAVSLETFSPVDGLATVRALLAVAVAQLALEDLQVCERILEAAAAEGVGWRLEIDF